MENLQLTQVPVAKAEMLIRRPVAEVFEAFINPAITTKFWFTRSSGRLEPGRQVRWDWEMYDASSQVSVKTIEENKRILIEWSGYGTPNLVEWIFTALSEDTTFVSITNSGFRGNGDEVVSQAMGSTEGFTLVLSGLKAYLEHNIMLNLVADRFPKGLEKS
ncbi:MAG: SRPBCC family protein [Chloroflexi bacterium]|nr:SRPBCC family protein [Chloroflexota bacterium]